MTKTKAKPIEEAKEHAAYAIPLNQLTPSDDNPRRDLGDLDELAESIRSVGILEPLIVIPRVIPGGTDGYLVVAGHRRLAGAKKAGVAEVPCIVRTLDDRERAEIALIENLQREGLRPLEEASVYERLVALGVKQRELAKRIGRSQPHISRRLSLLKLPEKTQAALDTGGITIEQATALSRVDTEAVEELFKNGVPRPWKIDEAVRRHDIEEKKAAARKELAEQGFAVVDDLPGPNWKHRLDGPDGYGHLKLTPEEHVVEPCHAGYVDHGGNVTLICTEPDRHGPEGDSSLKTPEDEPAEFVAADSAPVTPEQQEAQRRHQLEHEEAMARLATRRDAIGARRTFAGELVRKAGADEAVGLAALVFSYGWYEIEDAMGIPLVAELLDIAEDTYTQASRADQVRAFAAKGSRNQARAVAAAAVAMIERTLPSHEYALRNPRLDIEEELVPLARAYFDYLAGHGYLLSDHDRELLPAPAAPDPDAEGADEAVAWYTGCPDDLDEDPPRWITDPGEAQSIAALYPDRLVDLDGEPVDFAVGQLEAMAIGEGIDDDVDHTTVVQKSGKKWRVKCSCGFTAVNTTEALANERGLIHRAEQRETVPA